MIDVIVHKKTTPRNKLYMDNEYVINRKVQKKKKGESRGELKSA